MNRTIEPSNQTSIEREQSIEREKTNQTLPSRPKHCRKTFATQTLRLINSRLQYYRRVLNQQPTTTMKRQQIQKKYDRDMKVRQLLNRAVRHLYDH